MKLSLFLCSLSLVLVSAMKRPYIPQGQGQDQAAPPSKRPRSPTNNGQPHGNLAGQNQRQHGVPLFDVVEAVKQNNWEAFVMAVKRGELSGPRGVSMMRMCMAEAIDGGQVSFLHHMLKIPHFRKALGTDLLDQAAKNPDTLWVVINAEYGKDEAEFLKDEASTLAVLRDNLMKMREPTRRCILERLGYNPDFGMNRVMIIRPEETKDKLAYRVGEVASRYFTQDCAHFQDVTNAQIRAVLLDLIEAMRNKDINALNQILKSEETPRLDDFVQLVLEVGLWLQDAWIVDAIIKLGHKFSRTNLQNLFYLAQNAVRLKVFEPVFNVLMSGNQGIRQSPEEYLRKGFYIDLIDSGDLLTLSMLRSNGKKIQPNMSLYTKLAEAAFDGDREHVAKFAQQYPEKFLLCESAWNLLNRSLRKDEQPKQAAPQTQ